MSKKLMLLAAGALSALAFMAIPSLASANEFVGTCGTGATCTGAIVGGAAELEDDGGTAVKCTSVSGSVTQTHNSTTGMANIKFHGCTGFGFTCTGTLAGEPAGTISTGNVPYHLVRLEPDPNTTPVGALVTPNPVTFKCAGGLVVRTVTGSVIGEFEEFGSTDCGKAKTSLKLNFAEKAGGPTGTQQWETKTTSAALGEFDLTSGSHNGGGADTTTSAQKGTGTITMPVGQTITLDC
jgi:hypothetical protein